MSLEKLDRRLFLRGLMLTSAGLVVPKPVQVAVPLSVEERLVRLRELMLTSAAGAPAVLPSPQDHIYRYSAMGIYANLVMYMAPP